MKGEGDRVWEERGDLFLVGKCDLMKGEGDRVFFREGDLFGERGDRLY